MRPLSSSPLFIERYFASNFQDQFNPFITPHSRPFAYNLKLRSYLLATLFYLLAFVLSYFSSTLPLAHIFLLFVYFLTGTPSLIRTVQLLGKLKISISALMTLSAFLSFAIGNAFEGALLLLLFALSGALEEEVLNKAKGSLHELNQLNPTKARVLTEKGIPFEKSIKDIAIDSHIWVQAGEVIPLDGVIEEGQSSVSLAQITGESLPLKVEKGQEVLSGSKNYEGALVIRTTQTYSSSTLFKLIDLITQAQERKPKLQKTFSRYAQYYAQSIIGLSFFFALSLPYFLSLPFLGEEGSVYRSIAFLIGASPCALILALPISSLTAISHLSKKGVLMKGSTSLERLSQCNCFVFDKTGTLTQGKLSLEKQSCLRGNVEADAALTYAASLEVGSTHPLAQAFIQAAENKSLNLYKLLDFKNITGTGVEGTLLIKDEKKSFFIGKLEAISPQLSTEEQQQAQKLHEEALETGCSLIALYNPNILCFFLLKDSLRPHAKEIIYSLKEKWGVPSFMLTGDHKKAATHLAKPMAFEKIYAELTPEEKLGKIQELSRSYQVAMLGDGLNDAPSLALAHCGLSMGKIGSQSSLQASQIILMQEDLKLIPYLFAFAKKTQRVIKQNLSLAILAISLTSLFSLFGLIPLWLAVIFHEGSTLLVGLNGLRLLKKLDLNS